MSQVSVSGGDVELVKGSVLIQIGGGVLEALCAEPAIAAFAGAAPERRVTVCCRAADLYVGHPRIDTIMYSRTDTAEKRFERIIELTAGCDDPAEMVRSFAAQLSVTVERLQPHCHLTSMDRLRAGRFGFKRRRDAGVVIILPDHGMNTADIEILAADVEERLGTDVIFVSGRKYADLEPGLNLTGKLMPREMVAILGKAAGWVGFDRSAAAMGWAAGKKGIVFAEEDFESPDATIRICRPACGREILLETVSEIFENDSETV